MPGQVRPGCRSARFADHSAGSVAIVPPVDCAGGRTGKVGTMGAAGGVCCAGLSLAAGGAGRLPVPSDAGAVAGGVAGVVAGADGAGLVAGGVAVAGAA